jgi:hypothetical protein
MKSRTINNLIEDYLQDVNRAVDLLENTFGARQILRLWRTKKIPQQGKLKSGEYYELHGIGCRVFLERDLCVDFDYGPESRTDGFDAWRLSLYADESPNKYSGLISEKKLAEELNDLKISGEIEQLPNSNLFFLKAK